MALECSSPRNHSRPGKHREQGRIQLTTEVTELEREDRRCVGAVWPRSSVHGDCVGCVGAVGHVDALEVVDASTSFLTQVVGALLLPRLWVVSSLSAHMCWGVMIIAHTGCAHCCPHHTQGVWPCYGCRCV